MADELVSDGAKAIETTVETPEGYVGENGLQSYFADGVAAVIPGKNVTKIVFFEELPGFEHGGLQRRVNVVLSMPTTRFKTMADLLAKIAKQEGDQNNASTGAKSGE